MNRVSFILAERLAENGSSDKDTTLWRKNYVTIKKVVSQINRSGHSE